MANMNNAGAEPSQLDLLDRLVMKSGQLKAGLVAVVGDGFEPFNGMNETNKENYLLMLMDLADELHQAASHPRLHELAPA